MSILQDKRLKRIRRHKRLRAKIQGTNERPRLSVFRSHKHIWVQLIDDTLGRTLAAASDLEFVKGKNKNNSVKSIELGARVGELIAKKALERKITSVVFDRGGYKYHGLVKAVAEGARKAGLKF